MTKETFDLLLARLHPERERAGTEYAGLRAKLARFFNLHEDYGAEDAADETLDRLARKLAEGAAVEHIESYAYSVARLILRERNKKEHRAQTAAERLGRLDGAAQAAAPEDSDNPADYYTPLAECLNALPEKERALLREYYAEAAHQAQRATLAQRLKLSVSQLRLRIFRLRARLDECLRHKRAEVAK